MIWDCVKNRLTALGVLLPGVFLALAGFLGCSSDSGDVAGNSAETGSPELAGILYLAGGEPAAFARVQIVPSDFDVLRDTLPADLMTAADEAGAYSLAVPAGSYSLEALDENSGKMLLVQNLAVPDSGSLQVNDTLLLSGAVRLVLAEPAVKGLQGVARVVGTTIRRSFESDGVELLVDSLPAGALELEFLSGDGLPVYEGVVSVVAGDTVELLAKPADPMPEIPADSVPVDSSARDTLKLRFVAPLAFPEGARDSLEFVSDFPLALRLADSLYLQAPAGGRWEARRVKADGSRSRTLPIAEPLFDEKTQQAVFWVNVDSLNFDDSLELTFDSSRQPLFAQDVFPTNRSYAAVWHFDGEDGAAPDAARADGALITDAARADGALITDAAEKQNFPGVAFGASSAEGVLGRAVAFTAGGYVVANNSAQPDSTLHDDLVFETGDVFSFSLWVRLDEVGEEQLILQKPDEYELRYLPDVGFVMDFYHVARVSPTDSATADTVSYIARWTLKAKAKAGAWNFIAFEKHVLNELGFGNSAFVLNEDKVTEFEKLPWDGKRGEPEEFKLGGFTGAADELMLGGAYRGETWTYLSFINQKPTDYWPSFLAE